MSSTMITIIQEDIASVCFTERLTDNNAIILYLNFEYPTFQLTFLVKVKLLVLALGPPRPESRLRKIFSRQEQSVWTSGPTDSGKWDKNNR